MHRAHCVKDTECSCNDAESGEDGLGVPVVVVGRDGGWLKSLSAAAIESRLGEGERR